MNKATQGKPPAKYSWSDGSAASLDSDVDGSSGLDDIDVSSDSEVDEAREEQEEGDKQASGDVRRPARSGERGEPHRDRGWWRGGKSFT